MLDSLPIPATDKDSRWLMIVLHGLGDSLAGYRWLPDALALPWLHYRLVNAPDHYFGGYSWYDFAGDPGPGVERSARLLFELLEDSERQGFPPDQTILFGFSQGCLMTIEVALRYPRTLAGAVGISGYVHEPERLLQRRSPAAPSQRFLLTHGTADPLLPIEPVRRQMRQLQEAGIRVAWHEFPKEHTIAGEEEISLIRNFVTGLRPAPSPVA
ncbi:MAG: serine esterase [Verrucomicrobiae bacterium]|nr:serine esterase [Verrucomicrobiae bacterium]